MVWVMKRKWEQRDLPSLQYISHPTLPFIEVHSGGSDWKVSLGFVCVPPAFFFFLNLSQSLSATGHSERAFSEAAVKTGTKGFQRKMEGKGSWPVPLLGSECGASFMFRAEGGRRRGSV